MFSFITHKADRKGFEPLDNLTTIGGLVNRSIRPLCHLSKSGIMFLKLILLYINVSNEIRTRKSILEGWNVAVTSHSRQEHYMNTCMYCQALTQNKKYCSLSCGNKNRPKTHPKEKTLKNICINCNLKTNNLKFCSSSCAATINNKITPKRKTENYNLCLDCGRKLSSRKSKRKNQLCFSCSNKTMTTKYGEKSMKEAIDESNNTRSSRHKYELIRAHAHRLSKYMNWKTNICIKCGWDKHTELCHIKPIHTFSLDCLLKQINSKENIIFLCPNCHWLMDNRQCSASDWI